MQCPYKIDRIITIDAKTEYVSDPMAPGRHPQHKPGYKQIIYQECAEFGCQMWSDILQDCRLAWSGMANMTAREQEQIYREHKEGGG